MKKLIATILLSLSALGATTQAHAWYYTYNYGYNPYTGSWYYNYQYDYRW